LEAGFSVLESAYAGRSQSGASPNSHQRERTDRESHVSYRRRGFALSGASALEVREQERRLTAPDCLK
jgi:hypothetical protein